MSNLPPAFQTAESRQAFCNDFPQDAMCSIAAIQDTIPTPPPVSPVLTGALLTLALGVITEAWQRRRVTTIERNDLQALRQYANGCDPQLIPWRPVGWRRPAWLRRTVGSESAATAAPKAGEPRSEPRFQNTNGTLVQPGKHPDRDSIRQWQRQILVDQARAGSSLNQALKLANIPKGGSKKYRAAVEVFKRYR